MKKVGVIGGAGPLASALFYETIIQESYLQALEAPEMILINYPFKRGLTIEERKQNERILLDELSGCVKTLERNEVEIGVVACNTLHLYMGLLPKSSIPFISLPSLIIEEAIKNGHPRLLLLGTQNTCRSRLYRRSGIATLCPPSKEQLIIDEIIDRVLEGKIHENDSILISQMISRLTESMPFDGIVLGCTDLPVLHHHFPIQSAKPFYDSIKIPARLLRGFL